MTSARGISFEVRPSATLTRLAAAIVALSTVAPFFTDLPWYVRWLAAAAIASCGYHRLAVFRRSPVISLGWGIDDAWTVTLRRGGEKPAVLAGSRVLGTAVFLHLRWQGGAGHLALLADNMPADTLRFLRARLGGPRSP